MSFKLKTTKNKTNNIFTKKKRKEKKRKEIQSNKQKKTMEINLFF